MHLHVHFYFNLRHVNILGFLQCIAGNRTVFSLYKQHSPSPDIEFDYIFDFFIRRTVEWLEYAWQVLDFLPS